MDERFTIGFLGSGIEDEFSKNLERGIMQRAEEENINVVLFPGKFINRDAPEELKYEYQYNSIFTVINEENIDALIIAADCIGTFASKEDIHNFIMRYSEIPSILIAGKDGKMSNITYDNCRGIEEGIEYLYTNRNCRKFAMLGGPAANTDACERKQAFIGKLRQYGIELEDRQYVEGDLSRHSEKEVAKLLDDNPDVEAVFCANDDMAICMYGVLAERGLVPGEDIYVLGYDNSVESGQIRPSLSSVWADPMELARQAFDMAYNLLHGRKTPSRCLDTMFVKRDSFGIEDVGCNFPDFENDTVKAVYNKIFYRLQGARGREYKAYKKVINDCIAIVKGTEYNREIHEKLADDFESAMESGLIKYADIEVMMDIVKEMFELISAGEGVRKDRKEVRECYSAIYQYLIKAQENRFHTTIRKNAAVDFSMKLIAQDIMQFANGNDQNYSIPLRKLGLIGIKNAYLYLLDEPQTRLAADEWTEPKTLLLKAYLKDGKTISVTGPKQPVDIDSIFKNEYITEDRFSMVMLPLFSNEILYGFLLCDMSGQMFGSGELLVFEMSAAVKMLNQLRVNEEIKLQLEQSLTALKTNNIELDSLSREDMLTGIYNRRGFTECAADYLGSAVESKKSLLVMYVDMDNLKITNDRYGHDEGDFALKLIAETLKSCVGEQGVIGRIGGDEFACVTDISSDAAAFRNMIRGKFDDFNKNSDKPYNITASVGIYKLEKGTDMSLDETLALADDDLYEEKKKRNQKISKV